jgi:hypothetical protein
MNNFAILTPYFMAADSKKKRRNIGDGFILRSIERHIGKFQPSAIFSTRSSPSSEDLGMLSRCGTVILGGANQLNHDFQIWPGLSANRMTELSLRFVPFGVGLNGGLHRELTLSQDALDVLKAMHEKIEYSSWRCPLTVRLIEAKLPKLKGRALMTGCPVSYDKPLLGDKPFGSSFATVAVTVTDRGDFWDRESETIRYAAKRFPSARKLLVLHQPFEEPGFLERQCSTIPGMNLFLGHRARLRALALKLGYEIITPKSADEALNLYQEVGIHFGSRLHAHLHLLSQAKPSFLTYVDERMTGFSEALRFPICSPQSFDDHANFDFEAVRESARASFIVMEKFIGSLKAY